jgi:hypothetical protein
MATLVATHANDEMCGSFARIYFFRESDEYVVKFYGRDYSYREGEDFISTSYEDALDAAATGVNRMDGNV